MAEVSTDWVCALLVSYADGVVISHEITSGTEAHCDKVSDLMPVFDIPVDLSAEHVPAADRAAVRAAMRAADADAHDQVMRLKLVRGQVPPVGVRLAVARREMLSALVAAATREDFAF